MPELPEVETVKRGLERLIVGKTIMSHSFDWPKSFPNDPEIVAQCMLGATCERVERRGKALIITLNSGYSLVVHLKMTGQLVYVDNNQDRFAAGHPNDSMVNRLPDSSTRVQLTFTDSSTLFFNDQRKFGWMRLLPSTEVMNLPFFRLLGPEPLADSFTSQQFRGRLNRRKNTTIKAAILDQTVLAGVGNIYADESLFMAKIHPAQRVGSIKPSALDDLHREIRAVLNLSIDKGGSTNKNYVDAEGRKGSYLTFAKVFRREGQPCLIDGSIIIKTRVAGRGTHYCPSCQILRRERRR
jgi:formamidopyrimidine-DNA glycosylase